MTTGFGRDYHRAKYHEYRRRSMEYVANGGPLECAHCGTVESLEFDHIDPALKLFNVGQRKSLKSESYRAELDKCQLLCGPCHRAKAARENEGFTHGTVYGFMRAKCECNECAARKRAWHDERNARRRTHSGRRRYGAPSGHGERITYTRGCRCDQCRAANSQAERDRLARKAAMTN